ncbi:GEM-like protein 4 [Nicotiana tabacum]|uniref:GEM-like protein 4 n=2 Tax=Nicotiana TaxID=4085 RepID=A0A1S3XH46_TOBAC|nr:PREDICTED: GEM-like protein 4 [Nicotiana sylvestris]XP_016439223.1 PREDICTED: GEM-like protein 4 [Nicotiana tabacum]
MQITRISKILKLNMKENHYQFEDQQNYCGSSSAMSSSFGTTPERHSSFSQDSETVSSLHSSSSSDNYSPRVTPSQDDSAIIVHKRKLGKKAKSYAYRIREHVKLGPKFSETVKGKLKIVKEGGRRNIFRNMFNVNEGEKLLKASQCYLYTTAGPIAGILFISTEKIAFCSERPIAVPFPSGGILRTPYKVVIPVKKIKRAYASVNENKPSQKYIEIVTEDNFEFWFMGFVRYEKAFLNLQKAISMSN